MTTLSSAASARAAHAPHDDQVLPAVRLIVQTFFVATALLLIGAARESGDFGPSGVRTALYIVGPVTGGLVLLVLYARMEWAIRRRPTRR
jgi:hypothetical protein